MFTIIFVFAFIVLIIPLGISVQRWLFKQDEGGRSTIGKGRYMSSAMISTGLPASRTERSRRLARARRSGRLSCALGRFPQN